MVALSKPEVILSHESDLDGFVSGLLLQRLAKHLFGTDVRLESQHYNTWKQRELKERCAWVADFTFEARLDRPNWVVLDHHPAEVPAKQAQLVHDLKKSAGLLCYELCRENGLDLPELEKLVHWNNVSDLFLENDPEFLTALDYASLVKVYGFWNLHAVIGGRLEKLVNHPLLEVMAVKRRVEDPLGFEWSRKNVKPIAPNVGYVETIIGNTNLIVHQLLEKQATPYSVLLSLYRRANSLIVVSFRSRNGEALPIAEKLQGGGHANACGAVLPRSIRTIPDAVDYLRDVLNPEAAAAGLNSLDALFSAAEKKIS